MSNAYQTARDYIFPEVIKALRQQNPSADTVSMNITAQAITEQVAPVLVNQTNNEPWYKSRVILGTLVAITFSLLQLFGFAFDMETQSMVVNFIPEAIALIGSAIALWGRLAARKPL